MTLLELAEKAGVKFHRCDAAWGGTWGWSTSESCKFNGSKSQDAACEWWARTTFGEGGYEVIKSLLRIRHKQRTNDKYRNDDSRTAAKNSKKPWSDQDKRLLFDTTLSDREIAAKIGRSLRAIIKMRWVCYHMAPEDWVAKSTPANPVREVK